MKAQETIKAHTHADLLNKLLGTNYKQWYKCTYDIKNTDIFIWMVCLNDSDNAGHRNKITNDTTIVEQFDKLTTIKNKRFYHGLERKHRLVFEKIESTEGRIYKFHGLYKLDESQSNEYLRILKLESLDYIL